MESRDQRPLARVPLHTNLRTPSPNPLRLRGEQFGLSEQPNHRTPFPFLLCASAPSAVNPFGSPNRRTSELPNHRTPPPNPPRLRASALSRSVLSEQPNGRTAGPPNACLPLSPELPNAVPLGPLRLRRLCGDQFGSSETPRRNRRAARLGREEHRGAGLWNPIGPESRVRYQGPWGAPPDLIDSHREQAHDPSSRLFSLSRVDERGSVLLRSQPDRAQRTIFPTKQPRITDCSPYRPTVKRWTRPSALV